MESLGEYRFVYVDICLSSPDDALIELYRGILFLLLLLFVEKFVWWVWFLLTFVLNNN